MEEKREKMEGKEIGVNVCNIRRCRRRPRVGVTRSIKNSRASQKLTRLRFVFFQPFFFSSRFPRNKKSMPSTDVARYYRHTLINK